VWGVRAIRRRASDDVRDPQRASREVREYDLGVALQRSYAISVGRSMNAMLARLKQEPLS
jgi:hypothetical protein